MKRRLLIVGSFPKKNKFVYGGITQDCLAILNSGIFSNYTIYQFSTSISNPPPRLLVRMFHAILRLLRFTKIILINEFDASLLFFSSGTSSLEKGFYSKLLKFKKVKTILLPRAGLLEKEILRKGFFQFFINKLLTNNDYVLCQGKNMKKIFKEELNYKSVSILNNWSTSRKFLEIGSEKVKRLNRYNYKKRKINLVFVGWLELGKGVYELVKASIELLDQDYEFNLFMIGYGSEFKNIKKIISQSSEKVKQSIKLIGWIDNSELIKFYSKSDIFILPSYIEGFPNALVEAMLCCIVPIVSDVGSIPDYIIDSENGLLVKPRSYSLLRAKIKTLLDNKFLIEEYSINAFNTAKKYFDQDLNLRTLDKLLIKLIDNKNI
ncbi:glycosyltransferase family 4 protein [Prochlorococcus marinus]|uniref:glycosyltransferase family 4 protein n=1 Tax=Prochlorococcus marinus TaxID=1219 RepID=UPI00019005D9|nr:glycosyltransferase family 4 protein [Prochlorococcus marinus]EEE40882.1 hypothetical protein P9202_1658 [Prochlorococcus marinus str. MIT 9202]